MHTSDQLNSSDFELRRADGAPLAFSAAFPDFHERDRVAIVSPRLSDGMLGAGASLLALATAFYDVQRARGGAFFDYPRHLALLGELGDATTLRASWGNLDVWPETNWIAVAPSPAAMLERVYALHADRLFWPANWKPPTASSRLPTLARRLLAARLKSVLFYGAGTDGFALRASGRAMAVLRRSLAALPGAPARGDEDRLRAVAPDAFLAAMADCFVDEPAATREAV